ncbi:MAG: Crp/Fnr family transcriptional regulator [Bacteroidia bacterium]|nr:Crp/Fnr family transcriptional regulator [Bacteroidia bacterium]
MTQNPSPRKQLIEFLCGFPALNEVLISKLVEMIPVIAPARGTILVREGEVPADCYFVLKGLVRQYQFIDGNERTTEFYTETHGIVSSRHYTEQTLSPFFLECMEDCLLIAGNMEIDEANYREFPELREITRHMLEQDLNRSKEDHARFILSSPADRYVHFMETRKDLSNRVPLHQIASYLGMTAESLSRIRKRIIS